MNGTEQFTDGESGGDSTVTIAAIGDLHVTETSVSPFRELFVELSDKADVLVLCGDLTNFGKTHEAEILADLSWPGPPPGRWSTEQRPGEVAGAGRQRAAGDGGRRQQREADQDPQHRVADRGAVQQRDRLVV